MTRSPFYFQSSNGEQSTLEIRVWTGSSTAVPANATYTLSKEHNSAGYATYEISELIRDYITQDYTADTDAQFAPNYAYVQLKQTESGLGAVYTGGTTSFTMLALEGYTEGDYVQKYLNDFNYTLNEYTTLTEAMTYYMPSSANIRVPVHSGSGFTVNSSYSGFSTEETPCSKFDAHKLVFVNKYGGKSDIWCTAKSKEKTTVKSVSYNSSNFDYDSLSNNFTQHRDNKINTQGHTDITLNTDYVGEDYAELMRQLMVSEYVWLVDNNSNVEPVTLTDTSLVTKSHVNDGLINYTINVRSNKSIINSIR